MTTSASRGIETVTSLRLCSRAPVTTISDCLDITPSECREPNGRSPPRKTRSTRPFTAISGQQMRDGYCSSMSPGDEPARFKVEPSPDGRGSPPDTPPPDQRRWMKPRFLTVVLVLLTVNFILLNV